MANKKATANAGTAIQQAALNKAKVAADTAQHVIDSMTLKAKTSGYVNVQPNTFSNMIYTGTCSLPPFQLGDTVRAGMAVAQIPDLKNWEVSAQIGELDRGHLSTGQKVTVSRGRDAREGVRRPRQSHRRHRRHALGPPLRMPHRAGQAGSRAAPRYDLEHGDHRGNARQRYSGFPRRRCLKATAARSCT